MQKSFRVAFLLAVLALAIYVRITGLTWNLTSAYGATRTHPDEFISLRGALQIDLLAGRLKAPGAYFEGTFNYYLWAIPQAAFKLVRKSEPAAAKVAGKSNRAARISAKSQTHADLLYAGRLMSVLFDLCAAMIVFLAIKEATQQFYPSLLGLLAYSLAPMEVVYAHFMRPHVLSNLLCSLVIWLSLRACRRPARWLLLTLGFISGLGAAARYPVGIIVLIPCLYLVLNTSDPNRRFVDRIKDFARGPLWLIASGFTLGLFIGDPMLFVEPRSVLNAITGQTFKYAAFRQFEPNSLLNLTAVWRYLSYLIPCAAYPLLWLIMYAAIFYLAFRRRLYRLYLPIVIFSALYLYFMAKGYATPHYARATMLLFPGICVLIGLAYNDVQARLSQQPIRILLIALFLLVLMPSVAFDIGYVRGMQKTDPRIALREDLQRLIGNSSATIGVLRSGGYAYTVIPAVEPLKSQTVTVQLQDPTEPAEFFLVGFPRPITAAQSARAIAQVERHGNFTYERTYSVGATLFGRALPLASFPQDMTYPFPTLLLFRAKAGI